MSSKKTIIFDLGGVLINWNPKNLFRKIFDDEAKMDWFLSNICDMHWNEQQDAGRPLIEGTISKIKEHPEHAEEIKAYYERWTEMLGVPIKETVSILKQLKASGNYNLYALTNWSAETFPIAIERYDFLQWFEGIVVSGTEKMKKPDPDFYQLILDRYNIDASLSLFIDDNQRNVEAANAHGIESIHYVGAQKLSKELEKRSIL